MSGNPLADMEAPIQTALGLARAVRMIATNPVSDSIDAQPVYILGREIEAALEAIEAHFLAAMERAKAA